MAVEKLIVEKLDTNMMSARVVDMAVADGAFVAEGENVVTIETDKATVELDAHVHGCVKLLCEKGVDYPVGSVLAVVGDGNEVETAAEEARATNLTIKSCQEEPVALPSHRERVLGAPHGKVRASPAAKRRAAELGIDLATVLPVSNGKIVHIDDVERVRVDAGAAKMRMVLLGAGLAVTQVQGILDDQDFQIIGLLDDDPAIQGETLFGHRVLGPCTSIVRLFAEGEMDAALVTISTSVEARDKLTRSCVELGIPLVNAIHATCHVAKDAKIGVGNILCAFCHVGSAAEIGDGNFFSAYNSIEHHSHIGSFCSMGPGCMTSTDVTMGDRVRMGTGVFAEPHITIGDDALISSGSILRKDVPANHVVKQAGKPIDVQERSR